MDARNPVLSERVLKQTRAETLALQERMTAHGSIQKTLVLLVIALATGLFTWSRYFSGEEITGWVIGGALIGLVVALVTAFRPLWAPVTGPIYAALEGLVLGGISAIFHDAYSGLPLKAVALTSAVLLVMLGLYTSRAIRVTDRLRRGVLAATGAVLLVYVVSFVLSLFGIQMPLLHGGGVIAVIFSLVVVGVAAFNLVLDFDFIETGSKEGLPKVLEWYAAFGLVVTLVWLYLEILRLLALLSEN